MPKGDVLRQKPPMLPNALLLASAIVLFHRSFLSGHITRVGLLVVLSSLLPLAYRVCGKIWPPLKAVAILLNAALFAMSAYAFSATVFILSKAGMLAAWFYILTGLTWGATLGAMFARTEKRQKQSALLLSVTLTLAGAFALYFRTARQWRPWMNAAFLAAVLAVALLNAFTLLAPLIRRSKWNNDKDGKAVFFKRIKAGD